INARTTWHFAAIGLSVLAALLSVYFGRLLDRKLDGWSAVVLGGLSYVVQMAVAGALLPAFHETPADFPAGVLWEFRVSSLGALLLLWTVITLVFSVLCQRGLRKAH